MSPEHSGGFSPEAQEQMVERPEPRIYVASLSDYNAGRLHGAWINANQEPDEIHQGIQAMLATSPEPLAEEWAIHDYDNFGPIRLSEYESIEHVARLAAGIAEHGEAFALWAGHIGGSEWERLDEFDERYLGEWNSAEDYAANLLEDMGIDLSEIGPEILWPYVEVDLAGFARDLSYDIDILDGSTGSVHVFES
jgi:antirestriction protein